MVCNILLLYFNYTSAAPPTEAARTGGASTPTNPLGDGGNPFTRFGPLVNNLPPIPATQHPDHFKSEGIAVRALNTRPICSKIV